MKSSSSSDSSSSNDSSYFSATPSPSNRENTPGEEEEEEEEAPMESSSSAAAAASSSSLDPSSSTRENTHGEEDAPKESSSSSSSAAAASSSRKASSLDPSSSTRENSTHQNGFTMSCIEEDTGMKPSASSSSFSCSSSSQPSSSNPSPGEDTHDVFISFRGKDTRRGFVSHLLKALKENHIRTYTDDSDLERGKEISSTLLKAIEQSKISIIVFSKNYASSRWTLDELVKIMKCQKTGRQLVLPIFYGITPSKVRKKRIYSGVLKNPMNLFWSSTKETEQKNAMKEAADLAGWDSSTIKSDSELLEVIVIEVKRQLECMRQGGEGLPPQNCSPEEPNSGDPSHSSPAKCISSHGTLHFLMANLWNKTWDALWEENERPHSQQPSTLYRNRYAR